MLEKNKVKPSEPIHHRIKKEAEDLKKHFLSQLLQLVTSGFGLVAALAWNELIKEVIQIYIRPIFGKSSGLISLTIYAVFVTFLAVFITYQLSRLAEKKGSK